MHLPGSRGRRAATLDRDPQARSSSVARVHPYLEVPGPVAIAHRGGGGALRENTTEAFAQAVAMGYRYLETDARATADGIALAFHDAALRRMTGEPRLVRSMRWADVATLRIDGECAVPRLDDVLAAFPDGRFAVDVKEAGAVESVVSAVRATSSTPRVCVGSFSEIRLRRTVRGLGDGACSSLGPRGVASMVRARLLGRSCRTTAQVAAVPATVGGIPFCDRAFVDTCHRSGLAVHVWTVNDTTEMHRLLDLRVDGIITDNLSGLLSVFATRDGSRP